MRTETRQALFLVIGLVIGAVLFFLCFAAVFSGIWLLLLLSVLCFAGFGALGVAKGSVSPFAMAIALTLPAVPWVLWLTPVAIAEAGLRGLLWPAMAIAVFSLSYFGGFFMSRRIASVHEKQRSA